MHYNAVHTATSIHTSCAQEGSTNHSSTRLHSTHVDVFILLIHGLNTLLKYLLTIHAAAFTMLIMAQFRLHL